MSVDLTRPPTGDGAVPAVSGGDTTPVEPAVDQVDPEVDPDLDPPVYDRFGNVRPRGTKGAVPMTFAERVEIAERLAAEVDGEKD